MNSTATDSTQRAAESIAASSRQKRAEARRSDLMAVAILLAIPTVLMSDFFLFGSQLYSGDLAPFYYPINSILRTILLAGELPSWNPFWSAGQPFAANPEFHVFYPPRWLILLPDFRTWFRLHILFHIYLAVAASYFLFRDLHLRIPAAFFGALTFGLGGFYLSYMKMPTFYFTLVWIPLIFALARRLIRKPGTFSFAAASLAWGVQLLAGEPTTILQTGVLLGCYALYEALQSSHRPLQRAMRNLSMIAALSLSAFLTGAVQMIPAADHVGDTVRVRGLPWEMVSTWSMPWIRPLEILYPDILGEKFLSWGHNVYPGKSAGYIDSFHVGTLAALLMMGALIHWRRPAGAVSVVAAGSFLLAAGENSPAFKLLYDAGILNSIRYPEKFALTGVVALTFVAVLFADRCIRRDPGAIRAMIIASIGVAVASGILVMLSFTPIYPYLFRWLWGNPPPAIMGAIVNSTRVDWMIAAFTAAAATALFVRLRSHEPERWWYALVFVFVVLDLGSSMNDRMPRIQSDFFDPPPLGQSLAGDLSASRTFHAADLETKTLNAPWMISAEAKSWISRNGMYPRLPGAWGFHSVLEKDYDMTNLLPTTDLFRSMYNIRRAADSERFSETILSMSNVGAVLYYDAEAARDLSRAPPDELSIDDVTPIRAASRNYPRYFFADHLVRITSLDDFVKKVIDQDRSGNTDRIAYVQFEPFAPGRGTVERVDETSNSVTLKTRAQEPGYLVLSITPHKYWRATIDGFPITLHTTNVGYQGLQIPTGEHEITLRYRNPLITVGAIVSTLAIGVLTVLLLQGIRRRDRNGPPHLYRTAL